MNIIRRILVEESGQGLIEYSLIISLVAIATIILVNKFGDSVYGFYEAIRRDMMDAL